MDLSKRYSRLMIDVVTLFKDWAESLGFKFDYGDKAMLNLLRSNKVSSDIYFLLSSPIKWSSGESTYGDGDKIASGNFLFVVKSNLDGVIYRQKGMDENTTKYVKNVVPLMAELKKFKDLIICSDYQIDLWKPIDGYNMLDTNTDGLVVDFTIRKV